MHIVRPSFDNIKIYRENIIRLKVDDISRRLMKIKNEDNTPVILTNEQKI